MAEILGSADCVARLVPHHVRLEYRSRLAAFDWAVAVLAQHLSATIRVRDVQRLLHHLSDSGVGLRLEVG